MVYYKPTALTVSTRIDVAGAPTGDQECSIDVTDDLLPLVAALVQLDIDSWELEGSSLRPSESIPMTAGSSTSLKGETDIISSN